MRDDRIDFVVVKKLYLPLRMAQGAVFHKPLMAFHVVETWVRNKVEIFTISRKMISYRKMHNLS